MSEHVTRDDLAKIADGLEARNIHESLVYLIRKAIETKPKRHVGWMNAYPINVFPTPEDAAKARGGTPTCSIGCIRVEFEEGEGL